MIGINRSLGTALSGNAHLAQSVGDILGTPLGTRVMRRDYGSMIADLIDQPMNRATMMLLNAASALALARWEPRLRLRRVRFERVGADGAPVMTIEADRTDLPPANARVGFSIPIRVGGIAPLTT